MKRFDKVVWSGNNGLLNKVQAPLETNNSFANLMQTMKVNSVCQARVNKETLSFTQIWRYNTKL